MDRGLADMLESALQKGMESNTIAGIGLRNRHPERTLPRNRRQAVPASAPHGHGRLRSPAGKNHVVNRELIESLGLLQQ